MPGWASTVEHTAYSQACRTDEEIRGLRRDRNEMGNGQPIAALPLPYSATARDVLCGMGPRTTRRERLDHSATDVIYTVSGGFGERNRDGIEVKRRGGEQARRCEAGSLKPLQDLKS